MPANQPIVLLREVDGERFLPIWIGAPEASSIAMAQQGVVPPRPLTHDLLVDLITALGQDLSAVSITDLRDGVFYALLHFASGVEISARPSDAIALAVRTGTAVAATEDVMDEAGVVIPEEESDTDGNGEGNEEEVERFKEFLDQIEPDDFAPGNDPSQEGD